MTEKELVLLQKALMQSQNYLEFGSGNSTLMATEIETIHKLKNDNPDKEFIPVHPKTICGQMKKVTLESVQEALEKEQYVVEVAEDIRQRAWAPIERMLQIK